MKKVTFLGPVDATFSHNAYNILARIYKAPKVVIHEDDGNCIVASTNGDVLPLVLKHGGYGALAMETLAGGRVAEPLESFIDLLQMYNRDEVCPIQVIGAIRLKIHFCLMARNGVTIETAQGIIAHEKAFGACKNTILIRGNNLGWETKKATSNGEAARLVARTTEHKKFLALGPWSAAVKYKLSVLSEAFEDEEAITTFFLIGPKNHRVYIGKENRVLIVFRVPHVPGALVKVLSPFESAGINLIQIYNVYTGNRTYDFVIEFDLGKNQISEYEKALQKFKKCVERHLVFGPFALSTR